MIMQKILFGALACLAASCGSSPADEGLPVKPEQSNVVEPAATPSAITADPTLSTRFQDEAQEAIREKLVDPESAKFSGVRVISRRGVTVACGRVNSRNSFGGMTGNQRFISNTELAFLEEEMEAGAMDEIWDRFC